MEYDEILAHVRAAIEKVTGATDAPEDQSLSAPLHDGGLDLDDLDRVSLIMQIESDLNIEIPEGAVFDTPAELARYVQEHANWFTVL